MDWNGFRFFRNMHSRTLKWILYNPNVFLCIYRNYMKHISMPFSKFWSRKRKNCSNRFNPVGLKKLHCLFRILNPIESILIHSRLLDWIERDIYFYGYLLVWKKCNDNSYIEILKITGIISFVWRDNLSTVIDNGNRRYRYRNYSVSIRFQW